MKVDKSKWERGDVGTLCDILPGTRIVKKETEPGEYFVYGGGDATFTTQNYNREDAILVARFALSQKCTRFVKGKFFLNDSGLTVVPKVTSLDFNFLKWHVFALNDKIYELSRGAAQKNLDMKRFPSLPLNKPSLKEQRGIAAELDAIQAMIDGYREQLTDLDRLAQSIFLDTFGDPISNPKGWEVKRFEEVAKSQLGKMINQKTQHGELKPFLCAVNVLDNCFNINEMKCFNLLPNEKDKYGVKYGDLLICEGGDAGRCAIWDKDCEMYFQKTLHRVRSSSNNLRYLMFVLQIFKQRGILKDHSKGLTIQHLTQKTLNSLSIPIPPLSLQQQFAEQVKAIERQKEGVRQQLADAETLMAERMQYYFS